MINDGLFYNHHLEQINQWFPYNGWRYKVQYNVKTNDGTIHEDLYPNGYAWYGKGGLRLEDVDVVEVMLRDYTLAYKHEGSSLKEAIAHELIRYKDDPIPEKLIDHDGYVTYVPVLKNI